MKTPIRVLLVEDDTDDQYFFIEALKQIENCILYAIAANGKEALQLLENRALLPDLIFTDINMPFMNGMEYLSEIKKNPRTWDIPVVMLSTDMSECEHASQLGAKAFIKKPEDNKMLRSQVAAMINLCFLAKVDNCEPVLN